MPTSYKDQFYQLDPGNPPPPGTPATVERLEFTDTDNSGTITSTSVDTIAGEAITDVWVNDTMTIDVPGVGTVTYTGVTFYTATTTYFTPTDGQVLQDGTFVSSTFVTTPTQVSVKSFGPTCFTPGTWIDVPGGRRRIEDLRPGDPVTTLDGAPAPVRRVLRDVHLAEGPAAPVVIDAGALGNDTDLVLSQPHRVLIADRRADLWFGGNEVLVAARHLVDGRRIRLRPGGLVTYMHLMFDRHEIVRAAGLWAESLDPACLARAGRHRRRLTDLEVPAPPLTAGTARPVVTRREAGLLMR